MSEVKKNKIPKIIHYCWFGGKPIPEGLQACIDTWSKLDGYKIMRWDESNCSFEENEFVRYTFREKKLGFIGDYYRLKAVYEYGGIYLDTDVKINRSFDPLLHHDCFFNFIFDDSIGTAIFGARPHHPFIKELLDYYDQMIFGETHNQWRLEERDGAVYSEGLNTSNYFWTYYLLKHYPALKLNNKFQNLGSFVIYPKEMFEIGMLSGRHYAIHLNAGVWQVKKEEGQGIKAKVKNALFGIPWLYDHVQIIVRKLRYKKLKKGIPFYDFYIQQKNGKELPAL